MSEAYATPFPFVTTRRRPRARVRVDVTYHHERQTPDCHGKPWTVSIPVDKRGFYALPGPVKCLACDEVVSPTSVVKVTERARRLRLDCDSGTWTDETPREGL